MIFRKCILSGLIAFFLTFPTMAVAYDSEREMLTGKITVDDLQAAPYQKWYQKNGLKFRPDQDRIKPIASLMNDVTVTIIMGTWCHDSQREVPRFYKIMQQAGIDMDQITMIAVDMDRKAPDHDIDILNITNTPTFIFYRADMEINRIVETPINTLEKDIMAILSGQDYRHSKIRKK